MGLAFWITAILAVLAWSQTAHCHRRGKVADGNVEFFGVFIYGPVAIVLTGLAIVFGLFALFGS